MRRPISLAALCVCLGGCVLVLDFDDFEVRARADGSADGAARDGGRDGDVLPPDGCIASTEICNGVDDDCNDVVDEAGFSDDDPVHCGACGIACHSGFECRGGTCSDQTVELSAHADTACARLAGGAIYCWGADSQGQTGSGTPAAARPIPVALGGLTGASSIAVGGEHACVVASGGVRCWGFNDLGQLGTGGTSRELAPAGAMGAEDAVQVTAGAAHSCLRTSTLQARCTGANGSGQLGVSPVTADPSYYFRTVELTPATPLGNVLDISAGGSHTCAVASGGSLYCWGRNDRGQLGTAAPSASHTPLPVGLTSVSDVEAGWEHTCALHGDGKISCWGDNSRGQLGDGGTADRATPMTVTVGGVPVAIAAGAHHTCALLADGRIRCWGQNTEGQLGDSTRDDRESPVDVVGIEGAVAIGAGDSFTCASTAGPPGPATLCWGANERGQLGTGSTSPASVTLPEPTQVP